MPSVTLAQGQIFRLQSDKNELVILSSHTCDLGRSYEIEPYIEILTCKNRKPEEIKAEATYRSLKSSRKLLIDVSNILGVRHLLIDATTKKIVQKHEFIKQQKTLVGTLSRQELLQFQDWLAQRYTRSAFPDAFNVALNEKVSSKHTLKKAMVKLFTRYKENVYKLMVDLDDEDLTTERPETECYFPVFKIIYNQTLNFSDEDARALSSELERLFKKALNVNGEWKIWRPEVDVMAWEDVTLRDSSNWLTLDFEHLSHDGL